MTKKKSNPLQAALDVAEAPAPVARESTARADPAPKPARRRKPRAARKKASTPSRVGTVLVGGHFPPAVKQQLRLIAAEEDTTSQALLEEALNLLFVKKGKTAIL